MSSRCTIPGLRTPPMPERLSPQWPIRACASVPAAWPGAGCTTSPAGLSTMMRCASSKTTSSGRFSPTSGESSGGGAATSICAPAATLRAGSSAGEPSTLTSPDSIRPFSRVRESVSARASAALLRKRSSRTPASSAPTSNRSGEIPVGFTRPPGCAAGRAARARRPEARRAARARRRWPPCRAGPPAHANRACGASRPDARAWFRSSRR